jgi:hypothetical protein
MGRSKMVHRAFDIVFLVVAEGDGGKKLVPKPLFWFTHLVARKAITY